MNLLLALLLFSFTALAHNNSNLKTYHLIQPDSKTMDAVAEEFEVVKKLADGFEIYVPDSKEKRFLQLAPKAELIPTTHFKS
jgi:hypothetical protein